MTEAFEKNLAISADGGYVCTADVVGWMKEEAPPALLLDKREQWALKRRRNSGLVIFTKTKGWKGLQKDRGGDSRESRVATTRDEMLEDLVHVIGALAYERYSRKVGTQNMAFLV